MPDNPHVFAAFDDVSDHDHDRRRNGRRTVDKVLVPLLRDPTGDGVLPGDCEPNVSPIDLDGNCMFGIVVGLVLSVPLWATIGTCLWLALR